MLKRLYGSSNLKANRYALFAFMAKDKMAAQEGFAVINAPESDIWDQNTFDGIRNWASSPLPEAIEIKKRVPLSDEESLPENYFVHRLLQPDGVVVAG